MLFFNGFVSADSGQHLTAKFVDHAVGANESLQTHPLGNPILGDDGVGWGEISDAKTIITLQHLAILNSRGEEF